jgi:Kelch motif
MLTALHQRTDLTDRFARTLHRLLDNNEFPVLRLLHSLSKKVDMLLVTGALHRNQCHRWFHEAGTGMLCSAPSLQSRLGHVRESSSIITLGGEVLILSGMSDDAVKTMEVYSVLGNNWTDTAVVTLPKCVQARRAATAVIDSRIICVSGGYCALTEAVLNTIYICQPRMNRTVGGLGDENERNATLGGATTGLDNNDLAQWTLANIRMREHRASHSAAFHKGRLWICGGISDNDLLSTIEIFDVVPRCERGLGLGLSDCLRPYVPVRNENITRSMLIPRCNFFVLSIHHYLFAVGGDTDGTIERYDSDIGRWELVTAFPTYRKHFAAVYDGHDSILIFGGQTRNLEAISGFIAYNVVTDEWDESTEDTERSAPASIFGQAVMIPPVFC